MEFAYTVYGCFHHHMISLILFYYVDLRVHHVLHPAKKALFQWFLLSGNNLQLEKVRKPISCLELASIPFVYKGSQSRLGVSAVPEPHGTDPEPQEPRTEILII